VNILCRMFWYVQPVGHQLLTKTGSPPPRFGDWYPQHSIADHIASKKSNGSEPAKVTRVRGSSPRTLSGNAFPRASSGKVVLRR
jgi:hypothetical protein